MEAKALTQESGVFWKQCVQSTGREGGPTLVLMATIGEGSSRTGSFPQLFFPSPDDSQGLASGSGVLYSLVSASQQADATIVL